ncbi:MAG: hypothetical protein R3B70_16915, partial [Polyangiaceae bacterium]
MKFCCGLAAQAGRPKGAQRSKPDRQQQFLVRALPAYNLSFLGPRECTALLVRAVRKKVQARSSRFVRRAVASVVWDMLIGVNYSCRLATTIFAGRTR